jgi:hypothetical protein
MPENLNERKKVTFSEYLDKDGAIVHIVDSPLRGVVVYFHNTPKETGNIKGASVYSEDGKLYFVPFDSLTFIDMV